VADKLDKENSPMRSRYRLFGFGAIALVAAACGGGSGGGDGNDAATGDGTVSAAEFASTVCTGMTTWMADIEEGTADLGAAFAEPGTDLEVAKTTAVDLLEGVVASTDQLMTTVEGVGVPDVEDGAAVVDALTASLGELKSLFESSAATIAAVDASDPLALVDALEGAMTSLDGEAFNDAFSRLEALETAELDRAFEESDECQGL
jgi:hypothetical protein